MLVTTLLQQAELDSFFQNPENIKDWQELVEKSTGFQVLQSPDFVLNWYRTYTDQFEPLIIMGRDDQQNLVGLIALAYHTKDQFLTHAGFYAAEYHGWLAMPDYAIEFLQQVLLLVRQHFPIAKWEWSWMPPNTPLEAMLDFRLEGIHIVYDCQLSPEWNLLDGAKLKKTLKSSSLKSKINRLKKRGSYKFEVISDSEEIHKALQIARYQCDFRKEVLYNSRPFEEDPLQIDFMVDLVRNTDKLHCCALWLDDQLLAFHAGISDGKRLCLGLITFDPSEYSSSPGTILLAELAKILTTEGFQTLDITPGNDAYKQRYANKNQLLRRPTILFNQKEYIKAQFKRKLKKEIKAFSQKKAFQKEWISSLKQLSFSSLTQQLSNGLYQKQTDRLYEIQNQLSSTQLENYESEMGIEVKRQAYQDLLLYKEEDRRKRLMEAMGNFRKKAVLYTCVLDGKLICYACLEKCRKSMKFGPFYIPESSYLIHDVYVLDQDVSNPCFETLLKTMLQSVPAQEGEKVYVHMQGHLLLPDSLHHTTILKSGVEITQISWLFWFKWFKKRNVPIPISATPREKPSTIYGLKDYLAV